MDNPSLAEVVTRLAVTDAFALKGLVLAGAGLATLPAYLLEGEEAGGRRDIYAAGPAPRA